MAFPWSPRCLSTKKLSRGYFDGYIITYVQPPFVLVFFFRIAFLMSLLLKSCSNPFLISQITGKLNSFILGDFLRPLLDNCELKWTGPLVINYDLSARVHNAAEGNRKTMTTD
ncbi:hypothetical protein NE237_021836 [Protea cynaroides]|uniref:Uncharacterized protein n=1 Tax=Protea cynaroides TaxID=273540 RepID=A0A9Q0H8I3_9MAGN|nr:hypothetical protein NE237_021836 [Protea cynaroides]